MVLMDKHTAPPGSLFARGWKRPPSKGFSRINQIKETIIYFYSLSVITTIAHPTPATIAKTALIAISGPP
jgi:hypothetical protein